MDIEINIKVNIKKTITIFILFLGLFFVPAYCVQAESRNVVKQEKELEDVERQIRSTKKSIKRIEREETNILDEVEKVNRKVAKRRQATRSIEKSIGRVKSKVRSAGKKIKALEKKRTVLRERLSERLRAMYKMRSGSMMKVLFSSSTSEDLGKRYKYMTMVMSSDKDLMKEYETHLFKLENERDRYDSLKSELEGDKKRLKKSTYAAKLELKGKKRLLKSVTKEKKNHLKMIKELENASKELKELLASLKDDEPIEVSTGSFVKSKGFLKMPVKGSLVSFYGKEKHPEFNTVTFNNGIVISSSFGSAVRNVHNGKVAFVGWLKGYGQMMIVDHGRGYYTLYGYLFKVLKKKGDYVYRGDEIALVGESGTHDEPGLYFEIRQKGTPRDPSVWLSRR